MKNMFLTLILLIGWCNFVKAEEVNTSTGVIVEEYMPEVIIEGKFGTGPDEFGFKMWEGQPELPHQFVVDYEGNIYILDSINNRIKQYNRSGSHITDFVTESYRKANKKEIEESKKTWNTLGYSFSTVEAGDLTIDDKDDIYITEKRYGIKNRECQSQTKVLNKKTGLLYEAKDSPKIISGYLDMLKHKKKFRIEKEGFENADNINGTSKQLISKNIYDNFEIKDVKTDKRGNFYIISGAMGGSTVNKYNKSENLLAKVTLPGYPSQLCPPFIDQQGNIYYLEYIPDEKYPEFPSDSKGIRLMKLSIKSK